MEYEGHMVPRLTELLKERGVRGYSGKRKAELIRMLRDSDSRLPGCSEPQPPSTWEPMRPPLTWEPIRPPSLQPSPLPTQKPGGQPKPKED